MVPLVGQRLTTRCSGPVLLSRRVLTTGHPPEHTPRQVPPCGWERSGC